MAAATSEQSSSLASSAPSAASPPIRLARTFRSFLTAEEARSLRPDCRRAFTAQAVADPARRYSAGSTFFLRARDAPRCRLEELARRVFWLHARGALLDPAHSGAEWWTQCIDRRDDIGVHWDRDYGREAADGVHVYPRFGTVTYMSATGGATVVFDVPGTPTAAARLPPEAGSGMMVCAPQVGKHLCFDGRLLHAAPADLPSLDTPEDDDQSEDEGADEDGGEDEGEVVERITFLVNVWIDHIPMDSRPYEPTDNERRDFFATATRQATSMPSPLEPEAPAPVVSLNGPGNKQRVVMAIDTGPYAYRMHFPVPTAPLDELAPGRDTVRLLFGDDGAVVLRVGGVAPLTDRERAAIVQERRRWARLQRKAAVTSPKNCVARAGLPKKGEEVAADTNTRNSDGNSARLEVLTTRLVKQMNPKGLKAALRERGLSTQGNKAALRERLIAAEKVVPSATPRHK